jgi:ABC-type nitrate/sulfonate/bicarbonate transport system substrate-binding protein
MKSSRESDEFSRRRFIHMSGGFVGGAVLAGSGAASACGSSSKSANSATGTAKAADFGQLDFQLSWIKNDEFSGEYLADTRGYYKEEGFSSLNLISGGPTISVEPVITSGKALIGISTPDSTSAAILKGAPLVIIGAQYQKSPLAVMSLAKTPINNPQEMIGKTIGVAATSQSSFNAFLKANNIAQSAVPTVPVEFDPTPLADGQVDGFFCFYTNQPNLLRAKGVDVTAFLFSDYGFEEVSETYTVLKSALTSHRAELKACMRAEIRGWQDSLAAPAAGPTLAVDNYGKTLGLALHEQTLESYSQNQLILTPDTKRNGLFTMTPALIDATIKTLSISGTTIAGSQLFDMSLINEVFEEDPSLKTSPALGPVPA